MINYFFTNLGPYKLNYFPYLLEKWSQINWEGEASYPSLRNGSDVEAAVPEGWVTSKTFFENWLDLEKIWLNLDKIKAKFGQNWLDLGKIKILHPQKHSISYGCEDGVLIILLTALNFLCSANLCYWKMLSTWNYVCHNIHSIKSRVVSRLPKLFN